MSDNRDIVTVAEAYKRRLWEQAGVVLSHAFEDGDLVVANIKATMFNSHYWIEYTDPAATIKRLVGEDTFRVTHAGEVLAWGANNWREKGWLSGDDDMAVRS